MDVAREPGAGIGRDISRGERAEADLDAFITKRYEQRFRDEGERAIEDVWKEHERQDAERQRAERTRSRAAWWEHLEGVYARLSEECRRKKELERGAA